VTADLTGFETVDAIVYHQLRLVVDRATVTLNKGHTLDGQTPLAEIELKVPSGYSSGMKVNLNAPIEVREGESTEILVDFDVEQNFVVQGSELDMDIKGVIFTPILKEKERSQQPG
jgi:hypothetical protein